MKQSYVPHVFRPKQREIVDIVVGMTDEYAARGHVSNLRAVYYQMVAHHGWPNTHNDYQRLGRYIADARLNGEIDWDTIEDQVRAVEVGPRFDSPADALRSTAAWYHEDLWVGQPNRPFVIIEKAALTTVLKPVCDEFDVPIVAIRGTASDTVLRALASEHLVPAIEDDQKPVVLYLGDHDPAGLGICENVQSRLSLYSDDTEIRLDRLALNWDQVGTLPDNVENKVKEATSEKKGDPRGPAYIKKFGTNQTWELDALTPEFTVKLVRDAVEALIEEPTLWEQRHAAITAGRTRLEEIADEEEAGS